MKLYLGKEKVIEHAFNPLPEYVLTYDVVNGWPVVTVKSAKEIE